MTGAIKIYTLTKKNIKQRESWYAKVIHQNERDPLACRTCDIHVKEGEQVLSRLGRGYTHIYHIACARNKKVI